jgi:predicted dienelactone hydrolase
MSVIDWALLLVVIAAAGWRMFKPPGGWLLPALGAIVVLAALQIITEEFFWHFLPAYLLIAALAASAAKIPAKPPTWLIWLARAGQVVAIGFAIAPFAVFVPVPGLPAPTGPYAVGTEIYRWVDTSRDEAATANPADKRNVIAQAWYPVQAPGDKKPIYMDGLDHLPPTLVVLPSFLMSAYDRIDTHATLAADISDKKLWPVLIFSPGFGAPRAWYTGLAAELASRGYVVVTLDHPYETPVTQLADGSFANRIDTSPLDIDARDDWMAGQQGIRASDLQFTLDRLIEGAGRLKGHLDLSRVVAIGHSFGGATAVAASGRDPRIAATVNIDGTPYGDVPVLHHPFLLLQSDYTVTTHGDRFMTANKRLLETATAPAWRYEFLQANHVVFMDGSLFFAPPARWALSQASRMMDEGGDIFGGDRDPPEAQRAAADIIDAFIRETLSGETGAVTNAVAGVREIKGGQVEGNAATAGPSLH